MQMAIFDDCGIGIHRRNKLSHDSIGVRREVIVYNDKLPQFPGLAQAVREGKQGNSDQPTQGIKNEFERSSGLIEYLIQ
jgi:hypothetical protein